MTCLYKKLLPKTFFIIFLCLTTRAFPQLKTGIIIDSDGFTNVRQSKSADSKVIGKIYEYETFQFEVDNSNWLSVRMQSGLSGYVHKSRVREINNCICSNWGKKSPQFVVASTGHNIQICAFVEKRIDNVWIISEARVTECGSNSVLLEIGAVDRSILRISNSKIDISKVLNLPVGKNWQYVETPLFTYTLDLNQKNLKFLEKKSLNPPYLTPEESRLFVNSINKKPPKNMFDFEGIMYKLFVAAISGDKEAENMFRQYQLKFNILLDGYVQEDHERLERILTDYQK